MAIEGPINKHYQILITNMNGKIEREVSCNTSSLQHIEHIATKDLSSELYVVYVMDDHRNMIFKQKISKE